MIENIENWEEIFMDDDANTSFNKFLNIYLRIFHACFIKKHIKFSTVSKPWITKGIKTSCNRKRELYLKVRDNNEMEHKLYYKHYCKILSKVIKEAKNLYYKEVITKSKNKTKTTWNIIRKETSKLTTDNNIKSLRINDHVVYNQITIANELNNYFLNIRVAGNISNKIINEKEEEASPLQNLFKYFCGDTHIAALLPLSISQQFSTATLSLLSICNSSLRSQLQTKRNYPTKPSQVKVLTWGRRLALRTSRRPLVC
jgi:hypothetical protein